MCDILDRLDAGETLAGTIDGYRTVALESSNYMVKLKIFIGFAQCFSLLPFTFDIPWSTNILEMMKYFELSSLLHDTFV